MNENQKKMHMDNRNNRERVIQTFDLSDKNFTITFINTFTNIREEKTEDFS